MDQYSVRAQLEETTRQLTLIGQLTEAAIGSINKTVATELKGGSLLESSAALTSAMQSTSISSSTKSAYSSSSLASSSNVTSSLKTSTNPAVHYSTSPAAAPNDNNSAAAAAAAVISSEKKSNFSSTSKIGSMVETRQTNGVEYEIYLGNELRDGQSSLEMVGYNTLIARVIKSDWDKHGDFSLECKRQIKLPYGANPQNSEHGILPSGNLIIKVPYK